MGRLLIVVGLVIAGTGLLIMVGVPLGRLPGDIVIRRGKRHVLLSAGDLDSGERHPDGVVRGSAAVERRSRPDGS